MAPCGPIADAVDSAASASSASAPTPLPRRRPGIFLFALRRDLLHTRGGFSQLPPLARLGRCMTVERGNAVVHVLLLVDIAVAVAVPITLPAVAAAACAGCALVTARTARPGALGLVPCCLHHPRCSVASSS